MADKKLKMTSTKDIAHVLSQVSEVVTDGRKLTKEDIEKTLNFAFKLKDKGVSKFQVSIATPMKGTKMYADCIKAGYFKDGASDDFSYGLGNFDTEHWSGDELTLIRKHMMKELNE